MIQNDVIESRCLRLIISQCKVKFDFTKAFHLRFVLSPMCPFLKVHRGQLVVLKRFHRPLQTVTNDF